MQSGSDIGLGLHLSQAMIEAQQGQVGVQSRLGEGTIFWFTLPPGRLTCPRQEARTARQSLLSGDCSSSCRTAWRMYFSIWSSSKGLRTSAIERAWVAFDFARTASSGRKRSPRRTDAPLGCERSPTGVVGTYRPARSMSPATASRWA